MIRAFVFLLLTAGSANARSVVVSYVPIDRLQAVCHGPAYGCAFWRDQSKPCLIYLPPVGSGLAGHPVVTQEENARTLAHEIAHCEHGAFHAE
jgi:hypothetical protein